MREAQLVARPGRRKRRAATVPAETVSSANILARDFTASAPNTRWLVDMTMLPTHEGWLHLAAVLDLYSRKIVGYATGDTATEALAKNALTLALATRQPPPGLLHHSDRGSAYRATHYVRLLTLHHATISMSRPHTCWDNAPMESFFSTLKAEIETSIFDSRLQGRVAIFDYIETFYNRVRLHSSLGYLSPDAFERATQS